METNTTEDYMMRIFSGACCVCNTGISTGELDWNGNELYTGDIVQIWHGDYLDTDQEQWLPENGLTVIVANQYTTTIINHQVVHKLIDENPIPYTMGIKNIGVQGDDWRVLRVKSHKDVVNGEHWPEFGFNFKEE